MDQVLASPRRPLQERPSAPAPLPPDFGPPAAPAVERAPHPGATALLLFFLFLEMSRVVEYLTFFVNVNLRPVLVITVLTFIAALLSGGLVRSLSTPIGIIFSALTCWLMIATVTSQWKGGSAAVLVKFWFSSYSCAILIPALVSTMDQCRKAIRVIGLGLIPMVVLTLMFQSRVQGREESLGTLGNPNDLAFSLLLLVPFAAFVIQSGSRFHWKAFLSFLAIGIALVIVLRTGSRAGLLTSVVLTVILFLAGTVKTKLKLLIVAGLLLAAALLFVSSSALVRYTTIFAGTSTEANMTADEISAVQSTQARKMLFTESVKMMFQHPVFGVGPGIFSAALAGEQASRGESQTWHEAHNSFTQMGSEAGIPAVFLLLAALVYSVKRSLSIYRQTRGDPRRKAVNAMAAILVLSLIVFIVCATFGNYSYTFHFAVLAGMVQALDLAYKRGQAVTAPVFAPAAVAAPSPVMKTATPSSRFAPTGPKPVRPVSLSAASSNYVRNRRFRDRRV